ncbi:MAG: hypothetical protein O9274_10505 [Limnobacter sp.]|uniref:hypothetical protein n=1 Tax=Limnobacter sp. TaxID=2003368 RepID=UPI0022BF42B5|nr:hypothetical protein [Limnobacter sp.]MCZ8016118.1 hypothetical protein [Limnobacter sp.]
MQVTKIAIAAAIASTFAMPMAAQASDIATLNGWGTLFAAAHSGQQATAQAQATGELKLGLFQRQQAPAAQQPAAPQPAPEVAPQPSPVSEPAPVAEAPAMPTPETAVEQASAGMSSAGKGIKAGASAGLSASVALSGEQLGVVLNKVDGVYQTAGGIVEGVTGGVLGTVQNVANMTSGLNLAAGAAQSGALNVAGLATATLAGNLSATASVLNAGQLGAITAVTSGLVQNLIAARPASLTGLLR